MKDNFVSKKTNGTEFSSTILVASFLFQSKLNISTNENEQKIIFVEIIKPDDLKLSNKTVSEDATKVINFNDVFIYVIIRKMNDNKFKLTRRKMPSKQNYRILIQGA